MAFYVVQCLPQGERVICAVSPVNAGLAGIWQDYGRVMPYIWQTHASPLAEPWQMNSRRMPEHCHDSGRLIAAIWQLYSSNMADGCYTPTRSIAAPQHDTAIGRAADPRPTLYTNF